MSRFDEGESPVSSCSCSELSSKLTRGRGCPKLGERLRSPVEEVYPSVPASVVVTFVKVGERGSAWGLSLEDFEQLASVKPPNDADLN